MTGGLSLAVMRTASQLGLWGFYLALLAAFCLTAWLLAADLPGWLRSAGPRRAAGTLLLLAAAGVAGQAAFAGLAPRGGYDNDHDFGYAGRNFFSPAELAVTISDKEISPLLLAGAGDLLSGRSLPAVPPYNRLLLFLAAVVFYAFLRRCGLGAGAAFFGFAVLYFNFLAALNGNTFATSAANLFYVCAALYAAASLDSGRRGLPGLAAALAALFLVWAGRYELAALPALFLAASGLRPGGGLRALFSARPAASAALCAACAALCGAWFFGVLAPYVHNVPEPQELLRPAAGFLSQFREKNLALIAPLPAAAAWALAAAAALLAFRSPPAGRGARWRATALLCGCLFFSSIFVPMGLYPLHFMRHQLYYFLPFAALAAFAWRGAWPARRSGWETAALALFCVVYLRANALTAARLEPERRTNDREWGVLLKAAAAWPEGCVLTYGPHDARRAVLKKYFPLSEVVPAGAPCVFEYIPAHCQVFRGEEGGRPPGCVPPWLPAAGRRDALAEDSFPHRFYTIMDKLETREPVPVTVGFYPAGSGQPR